MEADRGAILMLLGVGILLGVLSTCGVAIIVLSEEPINVQEQVDIQEEEMEVIGVYMLGTRDIIKIHDNKDKVTCWVSSAFSGGGISCIPDHMLSP